MFYLKKNISIFFALMMTSPGKRNCANCIGALSFPNIQGGQKTGLFLEVDNFATVSDRKACDSSTVSRFCLEKRVVLGCW